MPAPLRFLNQSQVRALGGEDPQQAFLDVVDTVHLLRQGTASMPAETHVGLDTPGGKVYALPARVGGRFNITGVKWTAHRPDADDGFPMAMTLTLLNRADNGVPIGLLESGGLTAARTAAVSAVALHYAAPRPVERVLLLGAGVQARAHLAMLQTLFPHLAQVTCWNRTPAHLKQMLVGAGRSPWLIVAKTKLQDALQQPYDALISCTGSPTPILTPEAMRDGTLLIQAGYHEAAFETIRRATQVVVDAWGDFCRTSAKSLFQMFRAGQFTERQVAADLTQLIVDGWRATPNDRIYFSSFGLNVFDIALAGRVLQQAAASNTGTALPLFTGSPLC
ncbi:ornithine cyclodeaminase family protein [Musicola keenii]|uniref:ornithine cyclodeaminase family protein n=1 Tax=Musicola keenii TaxID=2884250 RepID=UPI001782747E|nr:ornithine cyclodeaminase family protein [Musicola keenii]